jgi:hypothetical protein
MENKAEFVFGKIFLCLMRMRHGELTDTERLTLALLVLKDLETSEMGRIGMSSSNVRELLIMRRSVSTTTLSCCWTKRESRSTAAMSRTLAGLRNRALLGVMI